MTLRECTCPVPNPRQDRETRKPTDRCVQCSLLISPEWTSNDRTMGAFYDFLAASLFIREQTTQVLMVPDDFIVFRAEAESRERAGRKHFGHRSLGRNNLRDAREEAADGANYLLFHHLKAIREEGTDDDIARVLTGASHFFKAHQIARELDRG